MRHQLAGKCLDQFTLLSRSPSTRQALRETAQWLVVQQDPLSEFIGQAGLLEELQEVLADLTQLNDDVAAWGEGYLEQHADQSDEYRFPQGVIPEALREHSGALVNVWRRQLDLAQRLEVALENRREEAEIQLRDTVDAWLGSVQAMVARAEGQLELWHSYKSAELPDLEEPWARWLKAASRNGEGVVFMASPVLARDLLHEHLWSRAAGVVMTSATLSALGSFDRLRSMTGLPSDALYKRVESPFDAQQGVFAIPELQSDPGDGEAHTEEIITLLPGLITNDAGVLMLFSSRRQMEAVVTGVSGTLDHEILVQDSLSKSRLLERHRENIDEGRRSLIMGLASFAEGIDLPGAYCDHVVIAKLPFSVPDNPREAAHAELLEALGRNAFMEISVPDAALRLVQASGRLLRTEEDCGRITLLDRRLLTRRYGRAILDSLPRYRFDLPQTG